MEVLLTAPVRPSLQAKMRDVEKEAKQILTRDQDSNADLEQEWTELGLPHSLDGSPVSCLEFYEIRYPDLGQQVYVSRVRIEPEQKWRGINYDKELIAAMNAMVREFAGEETDVCWVNRVALVPDPDRDVPAGWYHEGFEPERLLVPRRFEGDGGCPPGESDCHSVRLSWGNSAASITLTKDRHHWYRVISGLADAQLLWSQLDALSHGSGRVIRKLDATPTKPREVREMLTSAARISTDTLVHEYLYDQLRTRTAGARRDAGIRMLRGWGYEDAAPRVIARVRNVETVAEQVAVRRANSYHRVVEFILLILGLTSALQLYLALMNTAYLDASGEQPEGSWGFLAWLRENDVDLALAGLSILLVIAGVVLWIRGNQQKS